MRKFLSPRGRSFVFSAVFSGALLMASVLTGASAYASKSVGNGGDAFDVGGGKIKIFDEIEYSEAFHPLDEPAYQKIILPQLKLLATKLPATAAYLEFIFEKGAMWFYVDAKLVDVDTTGSTNVVLTSNKIQAAITKNGITQISRAVKNRLSLESFAFLLLHEALWSADADPKIMQLFGPMASLNRTGLVEYVTLEPVRDLRLTTTSQNIRALTGILMNSVMNRYDGQTLARLIESHTGSAFDMIVTNGNIETRKVGFTAWNVPFPVSNETTRLLGKWRLDREGIMVTGLRSNRTPLALVTWLDIKVEELKRKP